METIDRIKIRHTRIRRRVTGTTERPRLAVHFSGQHIYVAGDRRFFRQDSGCRFDRRIGC